MRVNLQSSLAWSRTPLLRGSCRGKARLCLKDEQRDCSTRSRRDHPSPSRPGPPRTRVPPATFSGFLSTQDVLEDDKLVSFRIPNPSPLPPPLQRGERERAGVWRRSLLHGWEKEDSPWKVQRGAAVRWSRWGKKLWEKLKSTADGVMEGGKNGRKEDWGNCLMLSSTPPHVHQPLSLHLTRSHLSSCIPFISHSSPR